MDVKNALRDWRIPLIFAVPVLLCAAVLYLALQPLAGSAVASRGGTDTITRLTTPIPIASQTPYPTAAPLPGAPYVLPCSTGVSQMRASVSVSGGNLVVKVVDQ